MSDKWNEPQLPADKFWMTREEYAASLRRMADGYRAGMHMEWVLRDEASVLGGGRGETNPQPAPREYWLDVHMKAHETWEKALSAHGVFKPVHVREVL